MKTILLSLIINFAVMGLDISPMSGKYGYSFSENRPVEMLSTSDILNLKEELKIKISKDNKSSKILNQLYNCISSIDVIHHGILNHEHIIVFSGLDFGKEPSILFFNVVDGVYKSISNEELKKVLSGNPSKYGLVSFDNYFFKISSADKERFKVALVKIKEHKNKYVPIKLSLGSNKDSLIKSLSIATKQRLKARIDVLKSGDHVEDRKNNPPAVVFDYSVYGACLNAANLLKDSFYKEYLVSIKTETEKLYGDYISNLEKRIRLAKYKKDKRRIEELEVTKKKYLKNIKKLTSKSWY